MVIPSNISPGTFLKVAADNNDINEETIDGKNTTRAMIVVVYQRKQFGPQAPCKTYADYTQKRRSLDSTATTQAIQEISVTGRDPTVTSYLGCINKAWFQQANKNYSSAWVMDIIWMLLRLGQLAEVFQGKLSQENEQRIPSWSSYHALVFPEVPAKTVIGYCPMINGSATEFSTIYTVMKNAQAMARSVDREDCVITFDLAIYMKAKQLQWRLAEEFADTVIRLGGFHIALNYLSVRGKKLSNSGVEDLHIESGVYGAGSVTILMLGRSYNGGIRAHKLFMEALFRLQLRAFLRWLLIRMQTEQCELNFETLAARIESVQTAVKTKSFDPQSLGVLVKHMEHFLALIHIFKQEVSEKSQMFSFWDDYITMVLALLQLVKAERTSDWHLHPVSVAALMPHFYSIDRSSYARWLLVYLARMNQLEKKHPAVWQQFTEGNHAVSRST